MCYTVIKDYSRQEHFDYYRRYRNPFYSMTFELEVTRLKAFVRHHGYRTYLNLCYFFTRAARGLEDYRYRLHAGEIVLYEELHPGLTVPAANGSFSYLHLVYGPDVHAFNRRAEEVMPDPDAKPDLTAAEHENFIFFTTIPEAVFTGFTHAWDEPTDGAPRVAFGNLFERQDQLWVSVGIQVNHCFIDGRALGELTRRAQDAFDSPEQ
ncbi:MAG: CatA-like O-acetyltransferase [Acidobacteriota bacterium]|nr:CatA-like O-acetyltransferase [Acidobacteriota bacterium]